MKRILTIAICAAALALGAVEAVAQSKKEQKREAAALQERRNLTAGTINFMNPDYSPDQHAVLVVPPDLAMRGALGQTVLLPPGNDSLQFIGRELIKRQTILGQDTGVQLILSDNYATAGCVLEAGKYYTVEYDVKAANFGRESAAIVELTDEQQLETARATAAAIRRQAASYFEYMRANPRELNGTFACRMPNIRFTFDGEGYLREDRFLGIGSSQSGRYWYDGKTVILYTDTAGTATRRNAETGEIFVTQMMHYTMDEGDWVISTKPIVNIRRKTSRYERQ